MRSSLELMKESLERARNQWRRERPKGLPDASSPASGPRPTIAISREAGAGGASIGREIGARLGWAVYDHELLDKISAETGMRTELLESLDEKTSHWLVDSLEAFGGVRSIGGGTYARYVAETMLALSVYGDCVIVGRGATMVLPPQRTLRVRLFAPVEYRIAHIRDEQGVTHDAAKAFLERTDHDRAAFVEQFFHRKVADVRHYDLVINSSRFSTVDAAGLVIESLDRWRATQRARFEPVTV